MPSRSSSRRSQPALARTIARRALDIAAAGDRSFVGFAGGLCRVGSWMCTEMNHAAGSAAGVVVTTVDAAKRLAESSWARRVHACRGETADSGASGPCVERCGLRDPRNCVRQGREEDSGKSVAEPGQPSRPEGPAETPISLSRTKQSRGAVDLLSALPVSAYYQEPLPDSDAAAPSTLGAPPAFAPESDTVSGSAPPDGSPAGVLPVLRALGRTVTDHVHQGYASLETDERFWTLVRLLESLAGRRVGDADYDAAGGQPSEESAASGLSSSKTPKPETELRSAAAASCEPES